MIINPYVFGTAAGGGSLPSLYQAIVAAGFSANVNACLDAGDITSWPGTGQKWLDLSGNGYDFFRGTTDAEQLSDPTFAGVAGALTDAEYWSFDGGDSFRYDSTNETWMDALHKNNAAFTSIEIVYTPTNPEGFLWGTVLGASPGVRSAMLSTRKRNFSVLADGNIVAIQATTDTAATANAWHFLALSIDEAGNSGFFYRDGAYDQVSSADTFAAAYTTPSSAAASATMEMAAGGTGALPLKSGSRVASVAFMNAALTKANLDDIFDEIRGRYGL